MKLNWIWPDSGPVPISQDRHSEMFDRIDYPYSETFVREAIQNSLDARLDQTRPVQMNFNFFEDQLGQRKNFLDDIITFRKKAELSIPKKWEYGKINWLVVEDFNTKGLAGDLKLRTSDFWNYWLNFGLSNKDGTGRGGRGIGRVTFLLASSIQSVIGFTRRVDDNITAVCGMSVLKACTHGPKFKSTHAYLAASENDNIYNLYHSDEFFNLTQKSFGFTGFDDEYGSGFGLAILYPYEELNRNGILAAAIENFAPAIMKNSLVITVDDCELNSITIEEVALEVKDQLNNKAIKADVSRYLDYMKNALKKNTSIKIKLRNANKSEFEKLQNENSFAALQEKINNGEKINLEISFPLKRYDRTRIVSLKAVIGSTPSGHPSIDRLFREGMSLPDVKTSNPSELDLVLLVDKGELATYLNFCEGKAHLDLQASKEVKQKLISQGFGDNPATVRRLIKALQVELRNLMTPNPDEPDTTVFKGYFSIPTKNKQEKGGKIDPNPRPDLKPKTKAFFIKQISSGFRVMANTDFEDWPVDIKVRLAYADGTRFPSWSNFDFELNKLIIEYKDCDFSSEKNFIVGKNCGPETIIEITGFDTNRELDVQLLRVE